jgi:hypothetical protein
MVKQTEKILSEALLAASDAYRTEILKTRIKISCPEGDGEIKYSVLDGGREMGGIELRTLLNIGIVDLFNKEQMVGAFMGVALQSLSFKNEIPLNEGNVRIYTKDAEKKTPLLCFLRGNDIIQHLTAEEIIDIYNEFAQQQEGAPS